MHSRDTGRGKSREGGGRPHNAELAPGDRVAGKQGGARDARGPLEVDPRVRVRKELLLQARVAKVLANQPLARARTDLQALVARLYRLERSDGARCLRRGRDVATAGRPQAQVEPEHPHTLWGTRRVQLVRKEGRDVSS